MPVLLRLVAFELLLLSNYLPFPGWVAWFLPVILYYRER